MQVTKIKIYLPQSVALAAARSTYGEDTVVLFDTDLDHLTPGERVWIAEHLRSDGEVRWLRASGSEHYSALTLASATITGEHVLVALRAAMAEDAAAAVARAAKRGQAIHSFLALSDAQLLEYAILEGGVVRFKYRCYLQECACQVEDIEREPGVVDRLQQLIPALQAQEEERQKQIRADEQHRRDREEAEKAKAEVLAQRKAAIEEDLRSFALTVPDLKRAAQEGYEVKGALLNHLAAVLAADEGEVFVEGSPEEDAVSWEKRVAPSVAAFEVLDGVRARVATMAWPVSVKIEVLPISRITIAVDGDEEYPDEDPPQTRYTGVIAVLSTAGTGDRVVIWRAEEE